MSFNNRNNFYSFPLTRNIGCVGFLIGTIVISAILFLGFFVGIFILGIFAIFYIYKIIKNKFSNNDNLKDNTDNFTDAEYIDISDDEDKKF
ncbi:MAG: hypothetical protein CMJ07_02650 [Pelagibacterales bacterium]|nr:hypothetical protein [Pelagibacterales bacterium]OUV28068.1 MAG: hypothetical protein CBC69_01240 [Alphaproteobacteria bacterium TMED109]|tara:strand:- start:1128 stop:1400 length:273 start_codon:yes stop_codon:yes gene_type:complete